MNSILALVLIGILFLVTSGGSFLPGSGYSRNSYGQGYYDYQDYGAYNQDQFYKRAGHADGKLFDQYQIKDIIVSRAKRVNFSVLNSLNTIMNNKTCPSRDNR